MSLLRIILKRLVLFMLEMIGPRVTLWSLYCIFVDVWSKHSKSGDSQAQSWNYVCTHLSRAADECERLEKGLGYGHRSDPEIIDEYTSVSHWIKTTDKYPLFKT
jgi:hypothetical protein